MIQRHSVDSFVRVHPPRLLELAAAGACAVLSAGLVLVAALQVVRWRKVRSSGGKWQAIVAALGPTWAKRFAVFYVLMTVVLIGLVVAMNP
jgi:hypothetical protein